MNFTNLFLFPSFEIVRCKTLNLVLLSSPFKIRDKYDVNISEIVYDFNFECVLIVCDFSGFHF